MFHSLIISLMHIFPPSFLEALSRYDVFILIVHLLCAVAFVGSMFFYIFVIDASRRRPGYDARQYRYVEERIYALFKPVLGLAVLLLFASGACLFINRLPILANDSFYTRMLELKVGMALLLALFFVLIPLIVLWCRGWSRFRQIGHYLSLFLMVAIIIVAKLLYL